MFFNRIKVVKESDFYIFLKYHLSDYLSMTKGKKVVAFQWRSKSDTTVNYINT